MILKCYNLAYEVDVGTTMTKFEEGMLTIMVDLKVEYRDTVLEIE